MSETCRKLKELVKDLELVYDFIWDRTVLSRYLTEKSIKTVKELITNICGEQEGYSEGEKTQ